MLLAPNLSLAMTPRAAVGALKASYIVCNVAANLPEAVPQITKLSPLLIALLGLAYGPALCLQCAWALGNMAAASQTAASTLQAQGAIPALLDIIGDASRASEDVSVAAAGATCAWALSNIMCGVPGPKAANVLLSTSDPRLEAVVKRLLMSASAATDLVVETAWLLVHTLRSATPGSQQLACRDTIAHSVFAAAEAATAAASEEAAERLASSRTAWAAAPPVRPPSPKQGVAVPQPGEGAAQAMDTDSPPPPQPQPGTLGSPAAPSGHSVHIGGAAFPGTPEVPPPLL